MASVIDISKLRDKEWLFPSERVALYKQGIDLRLGPQTVHITDVNFNGPAPENALTLEFALPGIDSNQGVIDPNDPVTKQELNKIRSGCKVWMVFGSSPGQVTIRSHKLDNIKAAVLALRDLLNSIAEDLMCRMITLVQRSSTSLTPIILKAEGGVKAFRGVTQIDQRGDSNDEDDSLELLTGNDFVDAVHQAGLRLRPVRGELFVRAHLGSFCALKREMAGGKIVGQYSTNKAFKTFLDKSAARGTSQVNHVLGDEKLATKVRDEIFMTENLGELDQRYQPPDPRIAHLRDVRPEYCLVLFSADRRIEIDVQYNPYEEEIVYTAGPPRVFANYQKAAVVEIAVASPEEMYDWHLAVQADTAAGGAPEAYNNLRRGLRLKSGAPKSDMDFPITHVDEMLLQAAKIDNIACKVSWKFECRSTPYFVEVSVYHEWNNNQLVRFLRRRRTHRDPPKVIQINTADGGPILPKPSHSCGISVYGLTWDEEMRHLNLASRNVASEFVDKVFYQEPVTFSKGFLEEMKFLQDIVSTKPKTADEVEVDKSGVQARCKGNDESEEFEEIDLIDLS